MMVLKSLIFSVLSGFVFIQGSHINSCPKIDTVNRNLRDEFCDQPLFVNMISKNEETMLYDNICMTYFPLPDDPSTFQLIASIVYCDGSNEVISNVGTDISQGVHRGANPFGTFTTSIFGYAGCDTYLLYVCENFEAKRRSSGRHEHILGLSSNCAPLGLSCLRKVEEIINDHNGVPDQDIYVLPMKLPNRCVTQRQCTIKENNPFYKNLGISGPLLP